MYAKKLTKEQLINLGIYSISEDGKEIIYKSPTLNTTRIIKQLEHADGYLRISFNRLKSMGVHRVVYAWFHGEVPEGMVVDHIDNNKKNNNINNLQLLTPHENLCKGTAKCTKTKKCKMTKPREYYEEKVNYYFELYEQIKKSGDWKKAHDINGLLNIARARLRYWDLHRDEYEKFLYEKNKVVKEESMWKRSIRCRRHAYEICKYYKRKRNLDEWHAWVSLKNKPELNMSDCYAIELTYSLLEKEINEYEKNE